MYARKGKVPLWYAVGRGYIPSLDDNKFRPWRLCAAPWKGIRHTLLGAFAVVDQAAVRADVVITWLGVLIRNALAEQGFTYRLAGYHCAEQFGNLLVAGLLSLLHVGYIALAELQLIETTGYEFFDLGGGRQGA